MKMKKLYVTNQQAVTAFGNPYDIATKRGKDLSG